MADREENKGMYEFLEMFHFQFKETCYFGTEIGNPTSVNSFQGGHNGVPVH